MSEASPLLAVVDLSIEFRTRGGTVRALEKVAFDIGRGETVALVGESGSGKSVTAYAALGLLDPAARVTSGRIVFGGIDLLTAGERALEEMRGRYDPGARAPPDVLENSGLIGQGGPNAETRALDD